MVYFLKMFVKHIFNNKKDLYQYRNIIYFTIQYVCFCLILTPKCLTRYLSLLHTFFELVFFIPYYGGYIIIMVCVGH